MCSAWERDWWARAPRTTATSAFAPCGRRARHASTACASRMEAGAAHLPAARRCAARSRGLLSAGQSSAPLRASCTIGSFYLYFQCFMSTPTCKNIFRINAPWIKHHRVQVRSRTPSAGHSEAAVHSVGRVGWPVRRSLGAHLRACHLRCSSRADCRNDCGQLSEELKYKRRNCVPAKVQHRIWLESPV